MCRVRASAPPWAPISSLRLIETKVLSTDAPDIARHWPIEWLSRFHLRSSWDIAKAGVSNGLGTPRFACEKTERGIFRESSDECPVDILRLAWVR
jgi:hypothetical protein